MIRAKTAALTLAIALAACATSAAQTPHGPSPAAAQEAMAPFVRIAGCYVGEGSMRMGPGAPMRARGTEYIEPRLGGVIVTVSGEFAALDGAASGQAVHNAFAVIAPDPAGGYRFNAHLANGLSAEMHGAFNDAGQFVWSPPPIQGRRTRYTPDWSEERRWRERGEVSMDNGATWMPFMEMDLHRQPTNAACTD